MLAALDADERILRSYLDVDRYRATVLGFVVTYGVVRTILVTLLTIMGRLVVIGDHHDGIASQRGPASASQEPHNACRPSRRSGGAFLRHRGSRGAGGRSRKWSLKRGPRSLQALLRRVPGDRALRVRLPRRPRWKRRLRGLPEGPRRPPISPLLLRHMSPPRERKLRKRP
ncbi:hypothetical protein DFJ74DRAFT_652620 [Hyaloraphidium curvatum]|nr:hypothetical protein DFJ74DRAFT_652620 [Hyaloraphidium curvatum]